MKKQILALVCSLWLLLLCGCGKKSSTLPPLPALAPLPASEISEVLQGYGRDALLERWGPPLRSMDGGLGDTWVLDETRNLMVLYNENGNVFVVRVQS